MDLNQRKLTKEEWNSIEIPVSQQEKRIIKLITGGYHDVSIRRNNSLSLMTYLKVAYSAELDSFVYCKYIEPKLLNLSKTYDIVLDKLSHSKTIIKKADRIRFANTDKLLSNDENNIFEFVMIQLLEKMFKHKSKGKNKKTHEKWLFYYYTITVLITYKVENINRCFVEVLQKLIQQESAHVVISKLVTIGKSIIEENDYLLKYADEKLYEHQKKLFTLCKSSNPKLILCIAPTGTGKTMSPLGLSEKHRIIFVCAARHVGLALAKAAISVQKKVAFAFGCHDAEDIRLHYFAAKDYTKNRRSGGIGKVDNTVGDKVEIMICDIKSYIPAMYYMLAFNKKENIILYWDEPTITMDYPEHEFHAIIHKNWEENLIPNVVLSSATLPQSEEMQPTIMDFRSKFLEADVSTIVSHDCKKTIPLIDKDCYVVMPHYLSNDYTEILKIVQHCKKYKTLLRYIDLGEAIRFIVTINTENSDKLRTARKLLDNNFVEIGDVTMTNIKEYYLDLLGNICADDWSNIYESLIATRIHSHKSNIRIMTNDAYTLTDGPTIFLADDIAKIAKFCLQHSNIPVNVANELRKTIKYNNSINEKVSALTKAYEDGTREDECKEKKMTDGRVKPEMKRIMTEIDNLNSCVKSVSLNPMFVPNTQAHQHKYSPEHIHDSGRLFTCDISESVVEDIMLIDDIDDTWKMLLLMGIGVFAGHTSIRYIEVMKMLAQQQKLYIIIASSDYIYGTNYQFCHGYISKDLGGMSQEKCIQAMGRVGRNNLQQHYSIRFRDNDIILKLFKEEDNKPEVNNMARLFNS